MRKWGVSTRWKSTQYDNGFDIIEKIAALGVDGVEFDHRLTADLFDQAVSALSKFDLQPLAIHAVCPAVEGKKSRHDAEVFQLSAIDEDERLKGVEAVADTIRKGADIGCQAVIVHGGYVPIDAPDDQLRKLYEQGIVHADEGMRVSNQLKIGRLAGRGRSFDQLLKSLEKLDAIADRNRITIGLENRYHFRDYPNFEELAVIFLATNGSRIKYWHNCGHAKAQENLGIAPARAYLSEFSDRIIGVHLSDVEGYTDHLAPPFGAADGVDFAELKRYLPDDGLAILEIRTDVDERDAQIAINWLKHELGE